MNVDILIPALNEEMSIGFVVQRIFANCSEPKEWTLRQVLVVDNQSIDATAHRAREAGAEVVYCGQPGYGSACLRGIDALTYDPPDILVFIDGDGADDPSDLSALLDPIVTDNVDLVIGSRIRYAESGSLSPLQRFGNALSCTLISQLFKIDYSDLGPFRAIKWKALQALEMSDQNFGWTVEMQTKAAKRGLTVREIDVRYRPRYAGESKISGQLVPSLKAGYKILSTIGKEALRSNNGVKKSEEESS